MLMLNYVLADMLRHMLVMRCKLLFLLFYEHFMRWNGNWLIDWLCFLFCFYTFEKFVCDVMGKWVGLTALFVWSDGEGGRSDCCLCVWTDGEGGGSDCSLCMWTDGEGVGLTALCWQPSRAITECDVHSRVCLYKSIWQSRQSQCLPSKQTNMQESAVYFHLHLAWHP